MDKTRSDLLPRSDDERLARRITRRTAIGAVTALGLVSAWRFDEATGKKRQGKKHKKEGPGPPKIHFVRSWGSSGSDDGQFSRPTKIAVARNGNFYVLDSGNNRVQFFDAKRAFLGTAATSNDALDVAVSPITGEFYVAERSLGHIARFTAEGTSQGTIGEPGTGNGQFQDLFSLAVGRNGEIYAGDGARVQQFDAAGAFVRKWGDPDDPDIQLGRTNRIAVATNGDVYDADDFSNLVHRFSASGEFLGNWGTPGTGEGQFDDLGAIAVAPNGSIFVADRFANHIQIFSKTGTFLKKLGSEGDGNGQFDGPYGLAISPNGQLYVADRSNDRIQQFELVKPKKKRKKTRRKKR